MPGKHVVILRGDVLHEIYKRIGFVFPTAAHLFLPVPKKFHDRGIRSKFRKDRNRLDKHTYRSCQTLVRTTVIDRSKKGFLFIVVFGQQESIRHGKEVALKNAVFFTESIHSLQINRQCTSECPFFPSLFFQIGCKSGKRIGTVKIPGIPLLPLLKFSRSTQSDFLCSLFAQRDTFRSNRFPVISRFYILEKDGLRSPVIDNVVNIYK